MIRVLAAAICLAAGTAHAATVIVTITGVRNDHGHVLVALCRKADFLKPQCSLRGATNAATGSVQVRFADVPAGTYAAQTYHDENDNKILDRNFFGLPKEGLGFSNDAPMHFGPPAFDAAAFQVDAGEKLISISLRYF